MKKSKSRLCQDRLSVLPESIIFRIFWLLPMEDFVRTSVLSKRWRKLWTTTTCLNFDCSDSHTDMDSVQEFISRALIMWKGTNIDKLKMDFLYDIEDSFLIDIDLWVSFALGKKVQELYVHCNPFGEVYSVPKYMYSCSWLKALSLRGCGIEINRNVQWNQLKTLSFVGEQISAATINQILCGSPQLEVFEFGLTWVNCSWSDSSWSIQSSSLKSLSIHNHAHTDCPWSDVELRISTSNLEELKISGIPFSKFILMDVSSLTHATLGFDGPPIDYSDLSYENDFLEAALRQIFPTIRQVEKLVLSDWCIKVLGGMNKKDLFPSFLNVKFLKLENYYANYKEIVGVLEIFPDVKMLAFGGIPIYHSRVEQEPLEYETNLPKYFLKHLRTTQVTCRRSENLMFPLIKIVLKYANKLEKMVMLGNPPSGSLHLASQKLLRMPRSSPSAELIFFEN